ncbi:BLUF domain-containing protein [Undibacterium sp. SXout11W]|uniref:BLUF domain-containing protein n=1 Tax=Undibacterium sp. SXout11W TaxID=3413050 RepID=UPI003BF325D4
MDLIQLIYCSAISGNDESILKDIHKTAVKYNAINGITGMLLYSHGRFLQVLEGEPDATKSTYYKHICKDPRHTDVQLLLLDTISERSFERWSMGFRQVSNVDIQQMPAIESFFSCDIKTIKGKAGVALNLLNAFVPTNN